MRYGEPASIAETGQSIFSKEETTSYFGLPIKKLLPFVQLRVNRIFEQEGAKSKQLVFRGRKIASPSRESLVFPHRGIWKSGNLRARIEDLLGLSVWNFDIPSNGAWEVSARETGLAPLPVVAASTRMGEELNLSDNRTGDPFDLKAYEQSDGIKRILWKTYARTGQLVVRRQEPAVLPEGEVAIFLVAEDSQDHVASALLGYIKQLRSAEVETLFSTDYQATQAPGFVKREDTYKCINESVFSGLTPGSGLSAFLEHLSSASSAPLELVIFIDSQTSRAVFDRLGQTASAFGTRVSFALVDSSLFGRNLPASKTSNNALPALSNQDHSFIECRPLH